MEDSNEKYKIIPNLNAKLNLCYYSTLAQPEENDTNYNKNPIFKLLSNYEDIQSILKFVDKDIIKFLYFNRFKVDKILYDSEEVIPINKEEKELNFYFYLSLLIEENVNVVNYSYPIKLIKNLNNQQTKEKSRKIRRIILAKLIIELIINYEQNENEENEDNKFDEDLKKMKEYNLGIIKDNIIAFEDFKLKEEEVLTKKIDDIYAEIIKFLIIKKQLNDSDKTDNLIKEIDLPSINLTKVMFDEISKILNKDYLKEYIIDNYEDIFEIKKINFYYLLLRYILKCRLYIYQIPFLLEARNKIQKIIAKNIDKFNTSLKQKKDFKDKIEYVLKYFIEFNYYNNKSIKVIKENIEATSRMGSSASNPLNFNNSKNMFVSGLSRSNFNSSGSGFFSGSSFKNEKQNSGRNFDPYQEEEKSEFDLLKEKYEKDIIFKTLTNSSFKFEFNKVNKQTEAKYCEIKIGDKEEKTNIDRIKAYKSDNDILNNNKAKFIQFLEDMQKKIASEFSGDFNFKVTLVFKSKIVSNKEFHINCIYQLEIPDEDPTEFQDNDIFSNQLEGGILFLINEINVRRE